MDGWMGHPWLQNAGVGVVVCGSSDDAAGIGLGFEWFPLPQERSRCLSCQLSFSQVGFSWPGGCKIDQKISNPALVLLRTRLSSAAPIPLALIARGPGSRLGLPFCLAPKGSRDVGNASRRALGGSAAIAQTYPPQGIPEAGSKSHNHALPGGSSSQGARLGVRHHFPCEVGFFQAGDECEADPSTGHGANPSCLPWSVKERAQHPLPSLL